ncbi:hypothetical protein MUK42_12022 [Musa troglodytarum]|uniref:Uncharacterized protein n=1 Tax=Musa troglodytarum TaxID=320322 RepID=A0A9E7GDN2_9LILI|nr:hypothetical protein MUK42_12022 [Musa troglodytarum]
MFLVLAAICWSSSEIARLSFLKGSLFSSITWQRNVCKLHILFNLGFSEPSIFLILVFLFRASLLKRELGALNQGWKKKPSVMCSFSAFLFPSCNLLWVLLDPSYSTRRWVMGEQIRQTTL